MSLYILIFMFLDSTMGDRGLGTVCYQALPESDLLLVPSECNFDLLL